MKYHLVLVVRMMLHVIIEESLICSIIVLILVITCIDLSRKIIFGRRHATNTPVIPYIPLIGSAYRFLKKSPLTVSTDICKDYESFYFWIFTEPYYITCDPDELQIILNHNYSIEKGSAYSALKSVFLDAMILSPASVWRKTRRTISKIFKYNVFITFIPSFNELGDEYIQTIEKEENTADLENKSTEFFVDTFLHNFVKYETSEEINELRSKVCIHEASKLLIDSVLYRMMNPWCYFDCIYKLTSGGVEYFKTYDRIVNLLTEIIHSRRKKRMDLAYSEEIDSLSLIDLMDEGGTDFQNMVTNLSFISGAAGETSGKVLTYTLAILGLYKDIQEKVYEEVRGVTGQDGMIDSMALHHMKYTKMVLFETMRMFTPLPMILRQVTEDLELKGRIIPKGTNILVHLMALHRNEKYWKDPIRFDPDRFSTEEVKNRHPYSYAPFSAGPRNCIGWKYADMINTTILGKIVRKYEISSNLKSVEEIKFNSLVLLDVPGDIRISFTPRNNEFNK